MAQFLSGKDLTNSNPPVLSVNPASEHSFDGLGQQGETQGDGSLDQSWTSTDPLGDSENYDWQNLLVFTFDQETEADATLQKSGLETESGAFVLVNSANDTLNSSGRYSSVDSWSGLALDTLPPLGPVSHNSASASSNQSFVKPSSLSVANQEKDDRASHRIGPNPTVRIEGWGELSQAQSSDVNQQSQDDQVSHSIDPNGSFIALDDWFGASRAQSNEVAARRVDKRKGKLSPGTSDKQSISSETDGDEVLSSGSNGEGRRYDLPHHPSERKNEADCLVPAIGMAFPSHDAAYEFYRNYASQNGFKVRKAKVQWLPDKTLKKRDFYCSKEGFRSKKENNKTTKYTRKETRTGCGARIQVEKKTVDQKEKWVISKAILEHNHPLENALEGDIRDSHGGVPKPVSVLTENEVNMPEDVPLAKCAGSSNMDRYNYLPGRQSKNLQSEDCQSLLDYLTFLQAKDPSFFYSVQVDDESRARNFFWTDGRSRTDYEYFGDVLVLDTAFRLGEHGMICAPFWGINHHQQCLLFGCAFLLDETENSFIWLLRSFLEAMGRRKPKTMFTNEDRTMADAVNLVLPGTQHRFDTSYICQNAVKHLPEHYKEPDFKGLFNGCIFDCQSKEEFQLKWDLLVNKYELSGNSWVQNLLTLRDKWSHLYAENTFNAGMGMGSLQGREKMRKAYKDISREATSLSKFVQQYGKLAKELRREEQTEDCCCNESVALMVSRSKIEKQAAEAYTTTMFKMFQEELRGCLSIAVEKESSEGLMSTFKLVDVDDKRDYIVTFNSSDFTLTCSCGKLESIGILCVHSLRVLNWQNIFHIPEQYVLKRWRKDAKDRIKKGNHVQPFNSAATELEHKAFSLIAKSAAKKECLKLVESCLHEAAKKVEEMLKDNPDSLIKGLNH